MNAGALRRPSANPLHACLIRAKTEPEPVCGNVSALSRIDHGDVSV
jgi:hypothetical protein